MSGGGSGGSTTVQKADPWAGVQPYLQQLYANAGNITVNPNGQQGPMVAQNSGVAQLNTQSQNALNAILQRSQGTYNDATLGNNAAAMSNGNDAISQILAEYAKGGGTANNAAKDVINGNTTATQVLGQLAQGNDASSQYLKSVLGGQYLNPSSNPYLSGAVDAASADATRNFQTAVMPQLASQFSLAGRYGSGAQSQGISDATNNLAQQLSQTAAGIYNQNYQNERGLQQNAAGTLSGIQGGAAGTLGGLQGSAINTLASNTSGNAQALSGRSVAGTGLLQAANQVDWNNLNQGLNAAGVYQQQDQDQLTGMNNLFNANQQQPYNTLSWLSGILSGAAGLNSQTSSTSNNVSPVKSAVGGAAAGALGGAALGSQIGAIGGPMGAGIGAGLGLLMGVL
jgi:hypothetical protein